MNRWARIGAAAVAVCVAVLLADYGVASYRAPRDDKAIKDLQTLVKQDASLARKLAAEQKRVTDARRSRKKRDTAVAWVLIAAASLFLSKVERAALRAPRASVELRSPGQARRPTPLSGRPEACVTDFVDAEVARLGRTAESAILLLQSIQQHYRYLPDEALQRLCAITEITPAQIAGTSSFYGQFRRSPVGEHLVKVCHGTACHVAGARQITDELRRHLGIPEGEDTDASRQFTIEEVACLGCCSLAPVLMVDGHTAGRLTPATASDALQEPV